MEFKDRLKKLRKELNLTQKELGKKINLAEATISHYETGIRMPDTTLLKEFANFFKVTIDYLLDHTNTRKESPYPIIGTGNEYFGFHKDIPSEAREEIINYAEYVIRKHEEKKKKGK